MTRPVYPARGTPVASYRVADCPLAWWEDWELVGWRAISASGLRGFPRRSWLFRRMGEPEK
jgi:hypothetical protein